MSINNPSIINPARAAMQQFSELSQRFGGGVNPYLLGATHKTESARDGFKQVACHLLPARESILFAHQHFPDVDTSGWQNLCRGSTRGCRALCLTNSGRLVATSSKVAAFVRSYLWQTDRELFSYLAHLELRKFRRRHGDEQMAVCRIYGTHDGAVERDLPTLVYDNPDVIFNDYTKLPIPTGWVSDNVYRVRSASELTTVDEMRELLNVGLNVTVPFNCRKGELPREYHGMPVIDGDVDDLRFLDPDGVIVGLSYKVAAHHKVADGRGFVRDVPSVVAVEVK